MILLIGNGPSADTPVVAAAIRRASRVLRMNNWQPGIHIGDRCEIWGTSFNIDVQPRTVPDSVEVWWSGWPYGALFRGPDHYRGVVSAQRIRFRFDRVASQFTLDFLYNEYHPSTGLIMAMMAVGTRNRKEPVTLAGFDHFRGERHHYWTADPAICDPAQFHDSAREQAILEKLGVDILR